MSCSQALSTNERILRGFMGGFSLGDYAYFVPYFDGLNAGHKVARVHVRDCVPDGFGPGAAADNFTGCDYEDTKVEFLDLHDKQPDLSGFFGGLQASMSPMYFFLVLAGFAAATSTFILLLLPKLDAAIKQYNA